MDLLENPRVDRAPSELGSIEWLRAELSSHGKPPAETVTWHVVEHALTLADQGRIDLAETSVIELSQQFDMTLEHYFDICMRLYERNQNFNLTSIFAYYIKNGGTQRIAFEREIFRYYQEENFCQAIAVFKKSHHWFSWKIIAPDILFLVANSFMNRKIFDDCFLIISFLVDSHPGEETFMQNMVYLALNCHHQPGKEYFRNSVEKISRSFNHAPLGVHGCDTPFVVDLNKESHSKIISSLYQHGFCHIRNGINVGPTQDILQYLLANAATFDFPIGFTPYIAERCASLIRFDALAVVNAFLPKPGALDIRHSVVRKVDPGAARSFTPFHQDATAFHKAIVNIWTPLTPAGGDYPTLELVKRRLAIAEATLETSDGYNLVKIDDAEILRKYQGDLYEPSNVAPGECIIFLGTTIHRSTNLKASTKPRYSLEVRWS